MRFLHSYVHKETAPVIILVNQYVASVLKVVFRLLFIVYKHLIVVIKEIKQLYNRKKVFLCYSYSKVCTDVFNISTLTKSCHVLTLN